MWAIISDIHSNLEALETALKDIASKGIPNERILCLGDVVGYGPNPIECVDRAMQFKLTLRGNHDEAVINEALGFNPLAREAIDWTRDQLKPGWLSGRTKRTRWEFLKNLPLTHTWERCLLVHGSPRDPTMEYVLRSECEDLLGEIPTKIKDIFSRFEWCCFIGHTHDPGIITLESKFLTPKDIEYKYELKPDQKYIINVGSIGQPRDGDPRICYVTFDGVSRLEYHRLEYDIPGVQAKIKKIPSLDPRIAERLSIGK